LVEESHVGVRWRAIEVEGILLHILAVVSLMRGEAEEPLLEDGVAAVPEGGGEDEELIAVADPGDPVLAPAVGLAAREVVGEEVPDVTVRAIVLADGRPRPVTDEWSPAPPAGGVVEDAQDPLAFFAAHQCDVTGRRNIGEVPRAG